MNILRLALGSFATGVLALAAVACAAPGGAQPTPAASTVKVPAPIESVEVSIAKSKPPQYSLAITSGLPSGCAKFAGHTVKQEGEVITVTVTNTIPADQQTACTAIYGYNKFDVPLTGDFTVGTTYTVKVNDVTKTFVGQGSSQATQQPGRVKVPAPIDGIELTSGQSGYVLLIQSGLPSGCAVFDGLDWKREGNVITVTILNTIPDSPAMACTAIYGIKENSIALGADFAAGTSYTFKVNDVTKIFEVHAPDAQARQKVEAPIENVDVAIAESAPPQYMLNIKSGLPGGCAQFHSLEVRRMGETVVVTVLNTMPAEPAPCTKIYGYKDHTVNLGTKFEAGKTHTVKVNDKQTTFTAQGVSSATGLKDYKLTVRAEPVQGQSRRFLLTADITGGADSNQELYCHGFAWEFGDGNQGYGAIPGCIPWTAEAKIQRHWEVNNTYPAAGVYTVNFSYGPLKTLAKVEVTA